VSLPWVLLSRDDPREFTIRVGYGGCDSFTDVATRPSDSEVVIAARGTHHRGGECTANLELHDVVVTLKDPLGRRTLTHVPLSKTWIHTVIPTYTLHTEPPSK